MKAGIFALALLWAGALFAQTPPPEAQGAHMQRMDRLAILLDLSDTQKTQVQTILEEEHAKMKANFEQIKATGTKPDPTQMHVMHQQLHQELITKLTPVLTPAQLKKFEALGPMMMGGHHGGYGRGGPGGAPTSQGTQAPPASN